MEKTIAMIDWRQAERITDLKKFSESGTYGVMIAAVADRYGEIGMSGVKSAAQKACDAGLAVGLQIELRCADPFAAHHAAALCGGENFTLPIAAALSEKGSSRLIAQGKDGLTDTVTAFLFEIERCGGCSAVKADHTFFDTYLDAERLKARRIWMDDPFGDDQTLVKRWGREFFMRSISNSDKRFIPTISCYSQQVIKL